MAKALRTAAIVVGAAAFVTATAGFGLGLAGGLTIGQAAAAAGSFSLLGGVSAAALGTIAAGQSLSAPLERRRR